MIFYDFLFPARFSQVFSTKKRVLNPPEVPIASGLPAPSGAFAAGRCLYGLMAYYMIFEYLWHWMMTYNDSSYLPSYFICHNAHILRFVLNVEKYNST